MAETPEQREAMIRAQTEIYKEQLKQQAADAKAREAYDKSLRGMAINTIKDKIQNNSAYQYAREKKDAFVGRATEITINTVKSKKFWSIFLLGLILFFAAYYQFPSFRTFVLGFGVSVAGLIAIFVIILFIISGIWKGFKGDLAAPFIAVALAIWLFDLTTWIVPGWPPYAGFELPPLGLLPLTLLPVLTSSFTFSLFYINMVLKIIKKEYLAFMLAFGIILISDYFLPKIIPSYLNIGFAIPFGQYGLILAFLIGGWIVWKYDRGRRGTEVAGLFSSLYAMFVFAFFWLNKGWQGNPRAWIHAVYIILFGFIYIKQKEKDNPVMSNIYIPVMSNIYIPTLLIIDFFGYAFIWNSDYLVLRSIPPLVIFVIAYCYVKESNEVDGQKKATYPVMAFILLVTFFLIMSVKVAGLETNTLPFIAKQGTSFTDFYSQFTGNLRELIEGRLDIATGGLYRGSVEKNRYESLGVYFTNIRAADPKFYTDEPITVWGSIRSKTYKDAVFVNFSCYRWKDNKKIMADRSIPEIVFPIFTLEEVDAECTFLPKKEKPTPVGANTITFAAEYNFATDAYLKTYFIDRERFRANAREGIDPLTQFGIKDKNPSSVSTNGPVEIGMSAGQQPVTVSEGYAVKPSIGITLTNRKEIQDIDKRIITKWDGKIKNITELVLLVPPGIEIKGAGDLSLDEACKKENFELGKCPCSMPFKEYKLPHCYTSCDAYVRQPCQEACKSVSKDSKDKEIESRCNEECGTANGRCLEECTFLFEVGEGEGQTKEKYKGYALDVGSLKFKDLNKDIDKHRSFACRFEPSSSLLDNTPITTRYFRVRARYNYLVENSVPVNVEQMPVQVINAIPERLAKSTLEFKPGSNLWFNGFSQELIGAIASVESRFRHCCEDSTKNRASNCVDSGKNECPFENLITSGSSYGIMQINYQGKNKVWVDELTKKYCEGNTNINNYDCNIKVGSAILKSKYDTFKGGCGRFSKISNACNTCKSNIAPYKKYSDYIDIEAALRGYNGWGCGNNADAGYVEKVLNAMKTVKGVEIIDPTTMSNIKREGEGMADATPSQEDETTGTPTISPPSNVQSTFRSDYGDVFISWQNPIILQPNSYRVTRYVEDPTGKIIESAQVICDNIQFVINQKNYGCRDIGQGLVTGKTYTYSVFAYFDNGFSTKGETKLTIQ